MGKLFARTRPSLRHQKIGRKAIRSDRMVAALEPREAQKKQRIHLPFATSKRAATIAVAVILAVCAIGFAGYTIYTNNQAGQQKIKKQSELTRTINNSAAIEKCRA